MEAACSSEEPGTFPVTVRRQRADENSRKSYTITKTTILLICTSVAID